jgi:polysaccharide deacetylase family protein (PEP-CTERM system associated)
MTADKNKHPIVLLTFDIEEYFQVQNLREAFPVDQWDVLPSSVEKNTDRILDILNRYGVKGTFFILGMVALKHEALIKKIVEQGHEIASHGFSHRMSTELSPKELKDDLEVSRKLLEDISGKPVRGYRAPNFSVNDAVIRLLRETGYQYDSSLNLFTMHSRYGETHFHYTQHNYLVRRYDNGIYEVPVPALSILKFPFPMAGGAYFRIIPWMVYKNLLIKYFRNEDMFNFYLHPWELEPEQPRVKNIKKSFRFRHYYGLRGTKNKLEKLIELMKKKDIRFLTIGQLIDSIRIETSLKIS